MILYGTKPKERRQRRWYSLLSNEIDLVDTVVTDDPAD
jgi:hypothetical protein